MLLLLHLLPFQYKIIRYYSFYNKKHSFHDKMVMLIHETKKIRKTFLKHCGNLGVNKKKMNLIHLLNTLLN